VPLTCTSFLSRRERADWNVGGSGSQRLRAEVGRGSAQRGGIRRRRRLDRFQTLAAALVVVVGACGWRNCAAAARFSRRGGHRSPVVPAAAHRTPGVKVEVPPFDLLSTQALANQSQVVLQLSAVGPSEQISTTPGSHHRRRRGGTEILQRRQRRTMRGHVGHQQQHDGNWATVRGEFSDYVSTRRRSVDLPAMCVCLSQRNA